VASEKRLITEITPLILEISFSEYHKPKIMTSNQLSISFFIFEEKLFDGNKIQSFFNFKRNKYFYFWLLTILTHIFKLQIQLLSFILLPYR